MLGEYGLAKSHWREIGEDLLKFKTFTPYNPVNPSREILACVHSKGKEKLGSTSC